MTNEVNAASAGDDSEANEELEASKPDTQEDQENQVEHKDTKARAESDNKNYSDTEAQKKIKDLSNENKKRRLEQKATQKELEEMKEKFNSFTNMTHERLINSELKLLGAKHKLRDINDIKKIGDMSKITIDKNGDVQGVEEFLIEMKESKPYLFDTGTTSQSAHKLSPSSQSKPVDVCSLSESEYQQRKRELFRKR